jgi:hypothetical protein
MREGRSQQRQAKPTRWIWARMLDWMGMDRKQEEGEDRTYKGIRVFLPSPWYVCPVLKQTFYWDGESSLLEMFQPVKSIIVFSTK